MRPNLGITIMNTTTPTTRISQGQPEVTVTYNATHPQITKVIETSNFCYQYMGWDFAGLIVDQYLYSVKLFNNRAEYFMLHLFMVKKYFLFKNKLHVLLLIIVRFLVDLI